MRLFRWLGVLRHFRKPFQLGSQTGDDTALSALTAGLWGGGDCASFCSNVVVKIESGWEGWDPFLWLVCSRENLWN
jgi:hypothetical protein